MKSLLTKLQARIIHIALSVVLILLVLYLSSQYFRFFLQSQNIDPSFIIGFFTAIALLLSLIQASKDKRYSYNLKLIDSIENKGLMIIGKLLGIKNKSTVILSSADQCIESMKQDKIFKDLNNSLSKENLDSDMELIMAYIDTYFPEQNSNWEKLINYLDHILGITSNILVNYQENLSIIRDPSFKYDELDNDALNNAPLSLKEAHEINIKIEALTLEIREEIVAKINKSKKDLKNSFDFSF